MLCDVCGKQKATVHLTEIINDQMAKLNLCEYCAKKKGSQMEQHFGIADLLQGMADPQEVSPKAEMSRVKCSNCGMQYEEFKKIGRLGCGSCYGAFRENLSALLKRIHGSNQHVGKNPQMDRPAKAGRGAARKPDHQPVSMEEMSGELRILRDELKKAVDREAFEDAAVLRDKIKTLEKGVSEIKESA